MSFIYIQEYLAKRADALRRRYADLIGTPRPPQPLTPPESAYLREFRRLYRAGYRSPQKGLYVVAAFDDPPRNRLQDWGRGLYYRRPRRYHFLLPLLGPVASVPNRPACGWQTTNSPPKPGAG